MTQYCANYLQNPHVEEFDKCDFTQIFEYLKRGKGRKAISEEERKCSFCYLDGQEQSVVNFRIESGVFIGRGNSPKSGSLRVIIIHRIYFFFFIYIF